MAATERKPYRMVSGRYYRRVGGRKVLFMAGDGRVFYPSSAEITALAGQIEEAPGGRRRPPGGSPQAGSPESLAPAPAAPKQPESEQAPVQGKLELERELGGGWFLLSDGSKVHGSAALKAALGNG